MMVGEQFDGADNDDICGAVVQNRAKGDRVAVWTSNAANGEAVMRIGYVFPFPKISFSSYVLHLLLSLLSLSFFFFRHERLLKCLVDEFVRIFSDVDVCDDLHCTFEI